jgi:chemotaxis protein MotB
MKFLRLVPLLFAGAVLMQSCVSKKEYMQLQADNAKLQDVNKDLTTRYAATTQDLNISKTRVTSLEDQIAQQKANLAALQSSLDKCLAGNNQGGANIAKLVDQINASDKYIRHLVAERGID